MNRTTKSAAKDPGIAREFLEFLRYNKKWWLVPILLGCLVIGGVAVMAASPVFPFIYTLF